MDYTPTHVLAIERELNANALAIAQPEFTRPRLFGCPNGITNCQRCLFESKSGRNICYTVHESINKTSQRRNQRNLIKLLEEKGWQFK